MSLVLNQNGLNGIATLSEGETQPIWCKSPQAYFYVAESSEYKLSDFCEGDQLCEIEPRYLTRYFKRGNKILTRYRSLFKKEHYERFLENERHFQQPEKIRCYIRSKIGLGNQQDHLKILNRNDAIGSELLFEYVINGEKLRQSILAGITNVIFEKQDGTIVAKIQIVDNWREILMKRNNKVDLDKLISILNQEILDQCSAGKSLREAAQIFGIKYETLIRNNSIEVQSIVRGSEYHINENILIEAIQNGMKISSAVICNMDDEDDEIVAQPEQEDIFSGFEPWLTSKDNPDYTGVQRYVYYVRSLPLLLTFMKEHDLIEDDNLNDLDVDKYNSIIEAYNESDEAKQYDYKYLHRKSGIAALRKYVKYINFLISSRLITRDFSWAKGDGVNKIFYGVPGCGKSYHIQHEILDAEKYEDKNVVRTTFYQDYSNTDFVGQILPKIKKDEDGKDIVEYIFNPGPFTLALIQAISNPTKKVALVIEEINRGNAPAIFGDIFQLLDRNEDGISEYGIKNVSLLDYLNTHDFDVDGKKKRYLFEEIKIPGNLSIYATMNTSDQNVYTLDTAFTRRWEKECIPNELTGDPIEKLLVPGMEQYTWGQFVKAINAQISDSLGDLQINEDKQVGRFFVKKTDLLEPKNTLDEAAKEKKARAFAHKVLEYLWGDVTKLDHSVIFNTDYKTFYKLVEGYLKQGVGVFNSNLFKD